MERVFLLFFIYFGLLSYAVLRVRFFLSSSLTFLDFSFAYRYSFLFLMFFLSIVLFDKWSSYC